MCLDTYPTPTECDNRIGGYPKTVLACIKPYVYEVVNGKRKRISPIVIENGIVTKIHERGIVRIWK